MAALPIADRTRRGIAQLRQLSGDLADAFSAIWRRSLQVRVVISTLALSTAVVVVLGLILQTQIALRVLQAKEADTLARAEAGRVLLERDLSGVDPDREGAQGELNNALDRLTNNTAADEDPASPGGRRVPRGAHHGARGRRHPGGRRPGRGRPARPAGEGRRGHPVAQVRHAGRAGNRGADPAGRPAGADGQRRPGVLPAVPADRRAAHAGPGAEHADRRRAHPAVVAGRHRQPGHPAGGAPGPAGRGDRRAVRRRPSRRAHAGQRGGRAGPARRVLQRDGAEHRGADPQAGGVRRAAAPLHLRRQPRAAHPADHGADGRRRAARLPGRAAAGAAPQLRAAGDRAGPVRGAAGRPAGDQPAGRRGGRPGRRAGRRARRWWSGRSRRCAGSPTRPAPSCSWSVRRRCTPRSTRAGWSASCATWWPTRSTTARAGRCGSSWAATSTRSPCWSATTASGCAPARRSWCSTGSGGPRSRGPGAAAAAAWACPSRWRTPGCTAAGCRPGARSGRVPRSG